MNKEYTVDVAGTGGTGLAAADAAVSNGLSVIAIEKLDQIGGNTRISSGFFAIDTKEQREAGLHLSWSLSKEFGTSSSFKPTIRTFLVEYYLLALSRKDSVFSLLQQILRISKVTNGKKITLLFCVVSSEDNNIRQKLYHLWYIS